MHAHRHSHGSVFAGRIVVVVACVLVLGINGLIYREASIPNHGIPALKVISLISLVWMFAGACAICMRKGWGRPMMLTILYAGSFAFGIGGIITLADGEGAPAWQMGSIFIGTAVYVIVSLVITHSRHVRRLTSRVWE